MSPEVARIESPATPRHNATTVRRRNEIRIAGEVLGTRERSRIQCTGGMMISLAQLKGTTATIELEIAQGAINDVLGRISTGTTRPIIELLPGNTILVRYGLLHARAQLPERSVLADSPTVTLVLASVLVAMAVKAAIRQPFITVHGRHLEIDLTRVATLGAWRHLWRQISELTFTTLPGRLRIGVAIALSTDDDWPAGATAGTATMGASMRDWLDAQLSAGFPALSGSSATGTLALHQDAVNELLARWLRDAPVSSDGGSGVDPGLLRRFVKTASIRAESGRLLIDFTVAI